MERDAQGGHFGVATYEAVPIEPGFRTGRYALGFRDLVVSRRLDRDLRLRENGAHDEPTIRASDPLLVGRWRINNGKKLLERFVRLDVDEPPPSRFQLRPTPVTILGTVISMGADLVYETSGEFVIRHLITDSEITRPDHLRLYGTALALHFEARPGGGPVSRVDLWLLRYENRAVTWTRTILEATAPRLAVRLDEIVRGAEGHAA